MRQLRIQQVQWLTLVLIFCRCAAKQSLHFSGSFAHILQDIGAHWRSGRKPGELAPHHLTDVGRGHDQNKSPLPSPSNTKKGRGLSAALSGSGASFSRPLRHLELTAAEARSRS